MKPARKILKSFPRPIRDVIKLNILEQGNFTLDSQFKNAFDLIRKGICWKNSTIKDRNFYLALIDELAHIAEKRQLKKFKRTITEEPTWNHTAMIESLRLL